MFFWNTVYRGNLRLSGILRKKVVTSAVHLSQHVVTPTIAADVDNRCRRQQRRQSWALINYRRKQQVRKT